MSGKVVNLLTSSQALALSGYRSLNSLEQLHVDPQIALTQYRLKTGRGQGGGTKCWDKKEIKQFLKNNDYEETKKWLID